MRFTIVRLPTLAGLVTAAALLLPLGGSGESAAAECPQADRAEVVQTLNRLYAAAGAHDAEAMRSVTSNDFAMQEDGGKVDGEALIQRLAGGSAGGPAGVPASGSGTAPADPGGADDPAGTGVHLPSASPALPAAVVISDPEVHILCDSAWATFRAPPALGGGDGSRPQSAVLNHQSDGWRVRFLNDAMHGAPETGAKAEPASGPHTGKHARRSHAGASGHPRSQSSHKPAGAHKTRHQPKSE